ncbi:MAG: RNase adapter RapZ [Ruminococcus sp.]|nr:RNase adapter RapZ [Ruminococcus sp.]
MELLIITGMSGAGKSTALRATEDLGYFCVDNMPPMLLSTFYDLCLKSNDKKMQKCAVVVDIRSATVFKDLYDDLRKVAEQGKKFKILFLDAKSDVLITRYKETRRSHPLADNFEDRSVEKSVRLEQQLLNVVKAHADYIIDTSSMSMKQLRSRITGLFSIDSMDAMKITCMSFGFKYGIPLEADVVFDVRCLPNPYYIPELKNLTGLDAVVRDYVMREEVSGQFLDKLLSLLDLSIPLYQREGKSELVLGIGCTGGKHRSVTIAGYVHNHLIDSGYPSAISHRDINKP